MSPVFLSVLLYHRKKQKKKAYRLFLTILFLETHITFNTRLGALAITQGELTK